MQLQGILLNALAMSKDTAISTSPLETASSAWLFTRIIASIVERPLRKPNWTSATSGPSLDRCWTRRFAITLSKSLPTSSSSTMGRYADGDSAGRPSFLSRTRYCVSADIMANTLTLNTLYQDEKFIYNFSTRGGGHPDEQMPYHLAVGYFVASYDRPPGRRKSYSFSLGPPIIGGTDSIPATLVQGGLAGLTHRLSRCAGCITMFSFTVVSTCGYHRLWTFATPKLLQMRCCSLKGDWNLVTNAGTQFKVVMATYFRPGVITIQSGKRPTTWLNFKMTLLICSFFFGDGCNAIYANCQKTLTSVIHK
ncbi:hypothetical protein K1T71_007500 [Dendrolimus kikuchii]|uniref:Uncharacterized protein n=1 Tax=Dendrolimus kikuchii TaxID=765133 RepID=A0ACC1D0V0_9NEOP|nr:hypothetical protein K1T71_007500 [Dendrolimus kikuchii]